MKKFGDLTPDVKEKVVLVLHDAIVSLVEDKDFLFGEFALDLSKEQRDWINAKIARNKLIRNKLIHYIAGKE